MAVNNKCVVVHAGARDNYQLALALAEKNYLQKLVTELYCPDMLTRLVPKLAAARYQQGLSSKLTTISADALLFMARMRLGDEFKLNNLKDTALGMKAEDVARRRHAHLFCYSYYAYFAFLPQRAFEGQKRLLFQLHPHPAAVRQVLQEELDHVPAARDSILYENEFRYSDEYLKQLGAEAGMADAVVVASSYTKRTLVENGVAESRIQVVPYGIDGSSFTRRTTPPVNKKLRVLFVGSMVQRKGLSYLLDAARKTKNAVELVLCGRGFMDEQLLNQYKKEIDLTIKRGLDKPDLVQEMHQADVFVLPTLSEGFAHVILEAMSCGLPIVTTANSCAPDIITEGREGFIIPIKNSEVLAGKLEWCAANKDILFDMGQAAADKAATLTWQKFRKGIVDFYESCIH